MVYIFPLSISLQPVVKLKGSMAASRILMLVLGMFFILLSLIFLVASPDTDLLQRLIVVVPMLALGVFLVRKSIRECADKTVVTSRTIELGGDADLENMICKKCGAKLSSKNIILKSETVFLSCPCCKTEYQLEDNFS